jgi:hypothetical protein
MTIRHEALCRLLLQIQYVGSFAVTAIAVQRYYPQDKESPLVYEFTYEDCELLDGWFDAVDGPVFAMLTHKDGSTVQFTEVRVTQLGGSKNTINLLSTGDIFPNIKD